MRITSEYLFLFLTINVVCDHVDQTAKAVLMRGHKLYFIKHVFFFHVFFFFGHFWERAFYRRSATNWENLVK